MNLNFIREHRLLIGLIGLGIVIGLFSLIPNSSAPKSNEFIPTQSANVINYLPLDANIFTNAQPQTKSNEDCLIKGNISSSGERIYHIPGGTYYNQTVITESKGEQWFCTETEARAAGWRRSLR